jgi:hypothetical protein
MPSRGVFRGVSSVLFDDPDYQHLSPHARLLLLTLRLCRDAGPSAIFEYATDKLMRQTGLPPKTLETAFKALETGHWVQREYPIVWVRNGLRYDPLVRVTNPGHRDAILRSLAILPQYKIVKTFCEYYHLPYPIPPEFNPLPYKHFRGTTPHGSPPTTPPGRGGALLKGLGIRDEGVGTKDLHAVEISEHVESDNPRHTWGDLTTLPQPPTSSDVAIAPESSKHPKPRKGHFADLVASLRRQHPDWPLDQLESAAIQHYYHP